MRRCVYINRAAHHGASVQGLLHDREQVVWSVLGFVHLAHAAGEVLHGLHGAAALQGLVAAVKPETKSRIYQKTRNKENHVFVLTSR